METERKYFAYCSDTASKKNYFIVSSKFLKPRPNEKNSKPGDDMDTLEQEKGKPYQSAWHESLEVNPDDGSFLDQKPKTDRDFEYLLTGAEYKDCLVIDTASSIQELQHNIKADKVEAESNKRRYDESVASGCQQHDEQQQQNKRIRSSNSNQQTSYKDSAKASKCSKESNPVSEGTYASGKPRDDTDIEMKEQPESPDVSDNEERGDTHIRPEGKANLGFFESEIDGRVTRQNADNVCVLVIHYDFKNDPKLFRNGDDRDVEYLKTSFGRIRNCNFRDLSPNKKTLLQLLGDDEKLLQFFKSQDDVPSVFVLFILSHGTENGIIWTDRFKRNTNEYEYFTTDEVFDSLQRLTKFDKCLKLVNFGPCRGKEDDSKLNISKSYTNYENKNSCRITTHPGMQNFVVFYSTVETTLTNTDKNGSWFVRIICTCLNNADDEPLLKFFTIVQSQMHHNLSTIDKNIPYGQKPELKMFQQDRKFTIAKEHITPKSISNTDTVPSSDVSKVNEIFSGDFSWKSDEGQDIRGRRGFILSVVRSKQVQEMKRVLENLDFKIADWTLSGQSMEFYLKTVSELDPDVGCIMTCIFGPVCENEQKEVCVRLGPENRPITDFLHSLISSKNDKLIGKLKILFVVNVEAPQTDNIPLPMKDLQVSATNHSDWLVLILKYGDALEKLIELFGKIGDKSLQELLEPLLICESNRENTVLLNSTLQHLIRFPNWPKTFVKPDFKLKKTKTSQGQKLSFNNSTESSIEEKIDFNTLLENAKQSFEIRKISIESPLQNVSHLENPQISSNNESLLEMNPVRDLEDISATRESADGSIVWLLNSVAGAGKSTVLKEMAHQLTKDHDRLKILQIPLKKYYRYLFDMPTLKVIEIEFLAKTTCNSHDDINNWIEKGELIVFFDGFDEVCPDFRDKIIKILIALNNARVPLFIGTRPHEVHHIQERIKNTTIVEIEPLDVEKQSKFLEIVARKNQQEIEQLRKKFKDKDILGNPLYLTLLAEYSDDKNLYEIFEKIVWRKVQICLKRENGGNDVGEEKINKKLKLIQLVASRFIRGLKIDQGSVTKGDLEKINAFGLVTYNNDTVQFTHQTFAEFLTAQKFLYDLKNPVSEKVPLFNDELMQCRKFVDLFFSMKMGTDTSYEEAFVDCAKSTDTLELVKQFCRENLRQMFNLINPDLSLRDKDGKNVLHFALRHLEMVKMLHEKDRKLATETTNNGESCLHLAIDDEECSEKVALWILEHTEVDKNAETKIKGTPLLLAGLRQKWKVAKYLLSTNVEVNKLSADGKSILHYAVQSNELDLVQAILKNITNINLKDGNGVTALHIAAGWSKSPEIVKDLLEKDAEVSEKDNKNRTALHYAAENNSVPEIIQKLLECGADVRSKDDQGLNALHLAAGWNENPEIVTILIENGVKVNEQDNKERTALHYAAENNQVAKVIQKLLEKGANVNSQDEDASSALHLAARYNKNPEIVQILLDNDAKVDAKDICKWTALLHAARFYPAPGVVQKLLDKGADINVESAQGDTALYLAVRHHPVKELIRVLLDRGANENEEIRKDIKCTTVLCEIKKSI